MEESNKGYGAINRASLLSHAQSQSGPKPCGGKNKLSSSFKKLLLYERKNIFFQRNIGVFILGVSCLKMGGELSEDRGRIV